MLFWADKLGYFQLRAAEILPQNGFSHKERESQVARSPGADWLQVVKPMARHYQGPWFCPSFSCVLRDVQLVPLRSEDL